MSVNVFEANRRAWNIQSANRKSRWTEPVSAETIEAARAGQWEVILTPNKPVPDAWFGDGVRDIDLLALASGGGQQAPIFAAAGARVVSFDASDEQLERDREVAEREGLDIRLEQGDMADLSRFKDASFDLIFHPVSNVFAVDILPVWRECARVLRPGGRLLVGFMNPAFFLFDHDDIERGGPLAVKFPLPFSDLDTLTPEAQRERIDAGWALEFGHSLDTQIGGQLAAGLVIQGLFEDRWDTSATPLNEYMPTSVATLALKPVTGP